MPTKIEWTHIPGYIGETWNPVTGCVKISPGCANCYAETMLMRFGHSGPFLLGNEIQRHEDRLGIPFKWKAPRAVFVNSVSDTFHEDVPDSFVVKMYAVMALTPRHIYQVLTKRPDRAPGLHDQGIERGKRQYLRRRSVGRISNHQKGKNSIMKLLSEYRPSIQRSYLFIYEFILERGYGPTIREIKSGCNLSSTSVASYHRDQLIKGGLITYDPSRDRSITLAGTFMITFNAVDAQFIREKFGDITTGAELVRELRNEEVMASGHIRS